MKKSTLLYKKFILLLTLLLLIGGFSVDAWGGDNKIEGTIGVGKGKGTVQVEVWTYKLTESDTNDEQKEVSDGEGTVKIEATATSSLVVWKNVYRYFRFWAKKPHEGYQFDAWYTDEACTTGKTNNNGSDYYQTSTSNEVKTYKYYAKFDPIKYTITFNKQSGSNGTSSATVHFDNNDFSVTNVSVPSRTGYTFGGYYTAANGEGVQIVNASGAWQSNKTGYLDANGKWIKAENTTLYAKWTANKYDVTLNANGGSSSDQVVRATYASDMPATLKAGGAITTPTRTDYTFVGYFDAQTGGTKYYNTDLTSARTWNYASDKTLYAHWKATYYGRAESYSSPAAGGGTWVSCNGYKPSKPADYKAEDSSNWQSATTLAAAPTCSAYFEETQADGYKFVGWYTGENGTGALKSSAVYYTEDFLVTAVNTNPRTTIKRYAYFVPVTVNSVASAGTLNITAPGNNYTTTAVFNVSNADATADFTKSISGDAGWEVTGWSYANNRVTVNVKFTCSATTTQGAHTANITLTSKATDGTSQTATVTANVNLAPTLTANPTTLAFGEYTLAKDTKKNKTVALTFNVNAITFEKTSDANIAPFSAVLSNNNQTLTVYFEPTTVGSWEKDLVVTVKNSQSSQLSAQQTIRLTGSAIRHTATITNNIANSYMVDNAALNLNTLWTSTSDGAKTYSIVSFTPSGSNNEDATAPTITNNTALSLGQAGTLEIKMTQPQTTNYNAVEVTKTITINKYTNSLTCDWTGWSTNLATDDGAYVHFSSDNEATPITVTPATGTDIATYYADQHAVYTAANLGSATWTVAQAENYKYLAPESQTLTVNVITVTEGCYVYGPAITDKEASKVGEINLPKAGAGNVLSFQMKYNGLGGQAKVIAFDANGNQLEEWYPETGYPYVSYDGGHEITLPAGTKKVNFQCPGSGAHALDDPYINNIRISRTEWINLQDVDGNTITSLEKMTNTIGGNSATATFYVDYSVCASEVRVASNNAHITVSPASFTPTAERQQITVTYTSATPETIDATITVYTSSQNATLNLTAETEKQTPYLIWGSLYQAEPVSLPVTFSDDAAATASNDAVVTYSVQAGEESVISIAADSRSFTIVGEGTAHLTATSAESTMWKSVSETKEINTTNKKIQNIVWDQNFTRGLKLNDERALTAEVSVYDFAAGTEEVSAARTALIQYTCPAANGVIEKIDATHFRVIGYGETTITASVAGNEEYEAASSVTKLVNVREAQTGVCDPALMTEITNEIKFEAFSLGFPEVVHEVELDRSKGLPDKLSFYVRGVSYNLAIEYYVGGIDVYESMDGGEHWSDILASVNPEKNTTAYSEQIQLSPDATHLRFVRAQGGQGYHYVGGINVTAIPELRVANAELDLGNIGCGATYNGHIELSYFNVKGDLSVAKANSTNGLSIEETIDAECGTTQTINVPFSVFPTEEGTWSNTVTITDELQHMSVEVHMTANVTKADQEIIWEPTLTVTGNNPPVLNAYATSGLPVTYEVTNGSNATIVNNEVVISGTGSFTIVVSQAGNVSYHAASLSKTFNVNPLTLILHSPAASDITTDQKLGDSQLSGGSAEDNEHNAVAGTWAWYDDVETTYAAGEYTPHVIFTPAANSGWYENVITTTALTVHNGQFIYTGTGDWNTEGNWNVGSVPTSSDEVLIEGNVTVSGNVSVQGLTIAQGADVTLNVSGKLNIGSGNSQNLSGYGDLHVREGGQVNLSNGTLKVRNFTLDAALSGTKGGVHQNAASGQVANPTKLDVRGEAYFVLTIDPADALTYGWYDFTVPFEVEISNGIYRYGENTPMRSGVDFMIMEYSESRRASGMKGWVNASGTLQPGRAYTITLDKWAYTTYVFKKKTGASTTGTNSFNAVASDVESQTRGWNGLGNGSLSHAQLTDAFSNAKVQLYDHAHNVYVTKEANESNFAVGTAFFIQVSEAQTIPFAAAEENRTLMAPSREVYTMDEFRLTLKDTETDNTTDRLWLSASEEATEEYVIGQDLLKMGTPTSGTVAQMWTMKGGKVLCDVETAMNGERATAPLSFYAPKAGQYELAIDQAPEDVTLYLTYNDQVIWILSFGSYVFDLEKGTTEGYGLRMETNRAPQITTDMDELTTGAQNRKVMINNTLYIVTAEGAIFDVMGKNIK